MLALGQEKIIYLTYPLSIIFIITSYLLIGLFGWPGSRTIGAWPAILTAIVIIILSMLVNKRYSHIFQEHKATIFRILNNFPHLQKNISSFVSFSWIYKGLDLIIGMVGKIVNQFTFMLEGNNGLLWGMVLLIILVMIIGLRV
jgi:hypothetical protein